MGVALSPYRVLGERPPAEALRALPVVEVASPVASSGNALVDEDTFATVRYHAGDDEDAVHEIAASKDPPLWLYLVAGFGVAFGGVVAWAMALAR